MKNKEILFLVPYPIDKAPSQRLKFEQYYQCFRDNGYTIKHESFISEPFWEIVYKKGNWAKKIVYTLQGYVLRTLLLFRIRKYDLVYTHLWVTPVGPPIFEYLVSLLAKKMIYDIDDLVYLKNNPHESRFNKLIKGKSKPIVLMKRADHVISCTPYLDSFVRTFNPNSTDISSTIDTDTYIPAVKTENSKKKIVLGWSGSHSTVKYLYLLSDILKEINKEHSFKLKVIGSDHFFIEGLDIEAKAWNLETEVEELKDIDIGLYPLPLDQEWVLGKSGLKALQYMALEIPTVATAIGANFRVIEDNVSGFLVTDPQEWKQKIIALIKDYSLRKRIGENARIRVEQYYSIRQTKKVYLEIIDNLVR